MKGFGKGKERRAVKRSRRVVKYSVLTALLVCLFVTGYYLISTGVIFGKFSATNETLKPGSVSDVDTEKALVTKQTKSAMPLTDKLPGVDGSKFSKDNPLVMLEIVPDLSLQTMTYLAGTQENGLPFDPIMVGISTGEKFTEGDGIGNEGNLHSVLRSKLGGFFQGNMGEGMNQYETVLPKENADGSITYKKYASNVYENGELLHKKGDYELDENGNMIPLEYQKLNYFDFDYVYDIKFPDDKYTLDQNEDGKYKLKNNNKTIEQVINDNQDLVVDQFPEMVAKSSTGDGSLVYLNSTFEAAVKDEKNWVRTEIWKETKLGEPEVYNYTVEVPNDKISKSDIDTYTNNKNLDTLAQKYPNYFTKDINGKNIEKGRLKDKEHWSFSEIPNSTGYFKEVESGTGDYTLEFNQKQEWANNQNNTINEITATKGGDKKNWVYVNDPIVPSDGVDLGNHASSWQFKDYMNGKNTPSYTFTIDKGEISNTSWVTNKDMENLYKTNLFQVDDKGNATEASRFNNSEKDHWNVVEENGNSGYFIEVEEGKGEYTLTCSIWWDNHFKAVKGGDRPNWIFREELPKTDGESYDLADYWNYRLDGYINRGEKQQGDKIFGTDPDVQRYISTENANIPRFEGLPGNYIFTYNDCGGGDNIWAKNDTTPKYISVANANIQRWKGLPGIYAFTYDHVIQDVKREFECYALRYVGIRMTELLKYSLYQPDYPYNANHPEDIKTYQDVKEEFDNVRIMMIAVTPEMLNEADSKDTADKLSYIERADGIYFCDYSSPTGKVVVDSNTVKNNVEFFRDHCASQLGVTIDYDINDMNNYPTFYDHDLEWYDCLKIIQRLSLDQSFLVMYNKVVGQLMSYGLLEDGNPIDDAAHMYINDSLKDIPFSGMLSNIGKLYLITAQFDLLNATSLKQIVDVYPEMQDAVVEDGDSDATKAEKKQKEQEYRKQRNTFMNNIYPQLKVMQLTDAQRLPGEHSPKYTGYYAPDGLKLSDGSCSKNCSEQTVKEQRYYLWNKFTFFPQSVNVGSDLSNGDELKRQLIWPHGFLKSYFYANALQNTSPGGDRGAASTTGTKTGKDQNVFNVFDPGDDNINMSSITLNLGIWNKTSEIMRNVFNGSNLVAEPLDISMQPYKKFYTIMSNTTAMIDYSQDADVIYKDNKEVIIKFKIINRNFEDALITKVILTDDEDSESGKNLALYEWDSDAKKLKDPRTELDITNNLVYDDGESAGSGYKINQKGYTDTEDSSKVCCVVMKLKDWQKLTNDAIPAGETNEQENGRSVIKFFYTYRNSRLKNDEKDFSEMQEGTTSFHIIPRTLYDLK